MIISWVNFGLAVVIIFVEIRWALKNPQRIRMAVPLLVWMVHAVVFYIVAGIYGEGNFSGWSGVLRTHGYLTVLMLEIYRLNIGENVNE